MNMENPITETIQIENIRRWSHDLDRIGPKDYPSRSEMKKFLEFCGANFDAVKGHEESLKKWTVARMTEAMEAVWGKERWQIIQNWNEEFIKNYETRTGQTLPHIKVYKKGTDRKEIVKVTKQASMKHFLGLMTRWAGFIGEDDTEFTRERLFEEVTVRITNRLLRERGIKTNLSSIGRPDNEEIHHPSLPPEYPQALIDFMISDEFRKTE